MRRKCLQLGRKSRHAREASLLLSTCRKARLFPVKMQISVHQTLGSEWMNERMSESRLAVIKLANRNASHYGVPALVKDSPGMQFIWFP
jgi:hypothetical protein